VYDAGMRYEDLVAAVDVVVTKPGYGIISECIANGTAMLYTSRGNFAEYGVMVEQMPRFIRCEYIELEALLAGRWQEPLERLHRKPPAPERPETNGAEVVAEMIAGMLSHH
jgi:L-arabinokinase